MDKDTEREIAKGLQEGDRSAWLQLYEAYAECIWQNIARLMGYDCAAVPDVVQETFLAAARSAKNFDPCRGSLWIWLCGIAKRQIALYYRKQDPKIILAQAKKWWASLDGQKIDWINAREDTPPEVLEARELAGLVRFRVISQDVDVSSFVQRESSTVNLGFRRVLSITISKRVLLIFTELSSAYAHNHVQSVKRNGFSYFV